MAFNGSGGERFRFIGPPEICSRYRSVARFLVERTRAMYDIDGAGADAATQTTRLQNGVTIKVTVFRQAPPIITITVGGEVGEEEEVRDLCPYGLSWQVEGDEPEEGEEKADVVKLRGGKRKENMPLVRQVKWSLIGPPKWKGPHVVDFWDNDTWKQDGTDYRQTLTRMRRNQACKSHVVGDWLDPTDPDSTGRPALYIKGGQWNGVSCAPSRPYADPPDLPGGNFPQPPEEPLPRDYWLLRHEGTTYAVVHSFPIAGWFVGGVSLELDLYKFWPGFRAPQKQEVDDGSKPAPIHTLQMELDISESNFPLQAISLLDVSSDGLKFLVQGTNRTSASECPGVAGRMAFGGTARYICEVALTVNVVGVSQTLELTASTNIIAVNRFSGSNADIKFDGKDAYIRVFTAQANFEAEKSRFLASGGDPDLFSHSLGSQSVPYSGQGPTVTQPFDQATAVDGWPLTGWYEALVDYSTISGGSSENVGGMYTSCIISAYYDDADAVNLTRIDRATVTKTTFSLVANGSGAFGVVIVVREQGESYPDTPYDSDNEPVFTTGTVTVEYSSTSTHQSYDCCILRHGPTRFVIQDSSPTSTTSTGNMAVSQNVTLRDGSFVQWETRPSTGDGERVGPQNENVVATARGAGSHTITTNLPSMIPEGYTTAVAVSAFPATQRIALSFGWDLGVVDSSGRPRAFASTSTPVLPAHVNPYLSTDIQFSAGLFALSKYALSYQAEISTGSGTEIVQYLGEHATCCATVGGDPKIVTVETYRRVGDTDQTLLSVGPFMTHKGIVNEVVNVDTKADDNLAVPGSNLVDRTPAEPRRHPADVPTCASVHPRADILAVGFRGPVSFGGMWPYNWPMQEDMATHTLEDDVPGKGLGRVVTLVSLIPDSVGPDVVLAAGWETPYSVEEPQ